MHFFCVQSLAGLLDCSPPRVSVDVLQILHHLCRLPVDPNSPDLTSMYDKGISISLLKNKAVANPLAAFAIANLSHAPATNMEWAGVEGLRVFSVLMSSVKANTFVSCRPGQEFGR